jgi:phage major head subunit gpT-like protein
MNDDYPDEKQRSAICYKQFGDKGKTARHAIDVERLHNREFLAGQNVSSINSEKRTVDIIFFTGADIPRMDFWTGEKYVLRFDPSGADLSLLNNGAPVLDNHNLWDGSVSQKGVVEKAWRDKKDFKATLRFSKRGSVNDLWSDIEDRIVTKFSMGVEILKVKKTEENDLKMRIAEEWRPFELSVAPIPADFGTTTLAAEHGDQINSVTINDQTMGTSPNGGSMPDKVDTTGTGAQTDVSTKLTAEQMYQDSLEAARRKAVVEELARIKRIREVTRWCNLEAEFADKYVDNNTLASDYQTIALNEQAKRGLEYGDTREHHVSLVRDGADKRRGAMETAVFGLMSPKDRCKDSQNPFAGLTIKQIAAESVRLERNLNRHPDDATVARLAMQATADFAAVLENTARKQLLARYNFANPSYRTWCKPSTTPDFKSMTRVRLGEAPTFLPVAEGAQIALGLMADTKETYSLATYGRGVSFTRQMLINDDLGAFNDLIGAFGQQAARLENKVVYLILANSASTTAPYAFADGYALIDGTHHFNTDTGVLGNTAFDSMFGLMRVQTGVDGSTVLNLVPKFLIVPAALESTARSVTTATGPNLAPSSQNWFAGRLEVVADGELDLNGSGVVHYFMVADPAIAPCVEYCHLEGAEGPQFIRKDNEQGVLGMQFYAYLDFAAKAVDWRSIVYSTGA